MSIYAIGDVQGCYQPLLQLLKKINFRSDRDRLWFAGDLVNRGPDSLKTLRFIKSLQDQAVVVLGNHDLSLLALANGNRRLKNHTLDDILNAPDRDDLLNWLRQQKLFYYHAKYDYAMVHAGIYPGWDLITAQQRSLEVEHMLCSSRYRKFLLNMFGNQPKKWSDHLSGWDRLRFITNAYTRMRFCSQDGYLNFNDNNKPGTQEQGYHPWFEVKKRKTKNNRIIFGHWSTLNGITSTPNVYALDTGCLWGGQLTAMKLSKKSRLDPSFTHQLTQIKCKN